MFIHWGLYALPAGTWKGEQIPSLGEWIMRNARIPVPEYEQLARRFNPVKFNADQWVSLAKRAGMKYLVITAKHHDGFAMYDSPCDPFNIVKATPFGRDPMTELAEACGKHGIRLCFYYSQTQDWRHPGGAGHWRFGEKWSKAFPPPEAFQDYLEKKAKPQVRELLTQYGSIGLIWFDTPLCITREQSLDLKRLVKSIQPDCIVCGRIGNQVGDYGTMGDNMIPAGRVAGYWETPATLNDTWGYKSYDHNWKSADRLLGLLVDLAGKGVNYLLNVGPTGEGEFPPESVERLEAIGEWMSVNGEAIYGTQPSPCPCELPWGRITWKGKRAYLHVTKWPEGPLRIHGIRSSISAARFLADPGARVTYRQQHDLERDWHTLELTLPPQAPGAHVAVLALDLEAPLDMDDTPIQQSDGSVTLLAHLAQVNPPDAVAFERNGTTEAWHTTEPELSWHFKVANGGRFTVEIVHWEAPGKEAEGHHEVSLRIGDTSLEGPLLRHRDLDSFRARRVSPEAVGILGEITLPAAGSYEAVLRATRIRPDTAGIMLSEVRLRSVATPD